MAEDKVPALSKETLLTSSEASTLPLRPPSNSLVVNYKTKFDCSLASHITQKILATILFFRQQIPCPLDQLIQAEERKRDAQKDKKRRKLTSGAAKQTAKIAKQLQSSLPSVDFSQSIRRVVLLIGTTVLSAKEMFIIHTDHYHLTNGDAKVATQDLRRKILRKFAMHWIRNSAALGLDRLKTRPSKFYILVEAHRKAELTTFHPKISFNLSRVIGKKRRERKIVHIHLQYVADPPTTAVMMDDTLIDDADYMWYQSKPFQGIA